MEFEWDPKKSQKNLLKHGISFDEARKLWQGISLTVNEVAKSQDGESRNATIGMIDGKCFTVIWTNGKKAIRILSVRRSRDGEIKAYKNKVIQISR